jgi:hypothetical protein
VGSITVQLTSSLTSLELAVWPLTIFVSYLQNRLMKPVKQEINSTMILPLLVFRGRVILKLLTKIAPKFAFVMSKKFYWIVSLSSWQLQITTSTRRVRVEQLSYIFLKCSVLVWKLNRTRESLLKGRISTFDLLGLTSPDHTIEMFSLGVISFSLKTESGQGILTEREGSVYIWSPLTN